MSAQRRPTSARIKRFIEWGIFYILLIAAFALLIFWQAKDVNTLGFLNGTIDLTTSKSSYTVGDSIAYTITNHLKDPVTITSACPAEPLYIYKWQNSQWNRIHANADKTTCATVPAQIILTQNASTTQTLDNWKSLFTEPGIYRLVALATNYTSLPYADFQVVSPPPAPIKIQAPPPQIIYQQIYTPVYVPVPSGGGGATGGGGGGGDD